MKQKAKNKATGPEDLPIEIVAKVEELPVEILAKTEQPPSRFPMIKSMIEKLDKFLSRRIASIGLFYLFAMIACGAGLVANGAISGASAGGENGKAGTLNIWLYSVIATLSLLILLIFIRVVTVRAKNKKK